MNEKSLKKVRLLYLIFLIISILTNFYFEYNRQMEGLSGSMISNKKTGKFVYIGISNNPHTINFSINSFQKISYYEPNTTTQVLIHIHAGINDTSLEKDNISITLKYSLFFMLSDELPIIYNASGNYFYSYFDLKDYLFLGYCKLIINCEFEGYWEWEYNELTMYDDGFFLVFILIIIVILFEIINQIVTNYQQRIEYLKKKRLDREKEENEKDEYIEKVKTNHNAILRDLKSN